MFKAVTASKTSARHDSVVEKGKGKREQKLNSRRYSAQADGRVAAPALFVPPKEAGDDGYVAQQVSDLETNKNATADMRTEERKREEWMSAVSDSLADI